MGSAGEAREKRGGSAWEARGKRGEALHNRVKYVNTNIVA